MHMAIQCFPPILGIEPRVLVLGSMPGIMSLEANEYYAHPRNAFWAIMEKLAITRPSRPYVERIDALKGQGIALWDVLAHCEREGSLDVAIRTSSEHANDFGSLLAENPSLSRVVFNGAKAESAFRRLVLPSLEPPVIDRLLLIRLPSTSPAHAVAFERKLEAWRDGLGLSE